MTKGLKGRKVKGSKRLRVEKTKGKRVERSKRQMSAWTISRKDEGMKDKASWSGDTLDILWSNSGQKNEE